MYAGFWLRLVAAIIDGVIFLVVHFVLKTISGGTIVFFIDSYVNGIHTTSGNWYGTIFTWLYFTLLESSKWQATVGKKLIGLKVTDETGSRIGFGRANARFWSKIISFMFFFIGFIMIAFTQKKQGLHDLIARTLVVRK